MTGRLDLMGATVPYAFVCEYCHFDDELRLVEASTKTVRLVACTLPDLNGARLRADGIINLYGSTVRNVLRLDGARVAGELCLRDTTIGPSPEQFCLSANGLTANGDIECTGLVCNGAATMRGIRTDSSMVLASARVGNAPGIGLDADNAAIGGPANPVQGSVDLRHASIGLLIDDPLLWPEQLNLDGLTYQTLEPRLPARERLGWLSRYPQEYQSQPYEQLATLYTSIGQPAEASRVLYARERQQRRTRTRLGRIGNGIQEITVGYGYRPWRAVSWLAFLLVTGTIVYTVSPPPALQGGSAPHFVPVVYTLDLLLPVVDLGQKHAFNPAGFGQWLSYCLIASGWVLATTIAAGAARILSRR